MLCFLVLFFVVIFFVMPMFFLCRDRAAAIDPVVTDAKVDDKSTHLPAGVVAKRDFVGADRVHKGFFANNSRIFGYNGDGYFLSQDVI